MKKFSELLIAAIVLGSHAGAGTADFPSFSPGTRVRVVTVKRQQCVGHVLEWTPQAMVVEVATPSACGAINHELRITPSDVTEIDSNLHPFWPTTWHVVTRPFVWACEGLVITYLIIACHLGANCSP